MSKAKMGVNIKATIKHIRNGKVIETRVLKTKLNKKSKMFGKLKSILNKINK